MVKSLIEKNINYSEIKILHPEDENYKTTLYESEIFTIKVIIALGKAKYDLLDKQIIYFPMYLIQNDKIALRIGLYEIISDKLDEILDETGAPDILSDEFKPLLFTFVNSNLLNKYKSVDDDNTEDIIWAETLIILNENKDKLNDDASIKIIRRMVESKLDIDLKTKKKWLNDKIKNWIDENIKEPEKETDEESESGEEESESGEEESESGEEGSESGEEESESGEEESESGEEESEIGVEGSEAGEEDNVLPEQTKSMAKIERTNYIENKDDQWIVKFLENNNYDILINDGGGDCFFLAINQALKMVGKNISVQKQREMLSQETTQATFDTNKEVYTDLKTQIDILKGELNEHKKEHDELKNRLKETKERDVQKNIIIQSKQVIKNHKQTKEELTTSKQMIQEWEYMKGITTLEAYRAIVQTNNFWADASTISTMERLLNVKFIIFSKDNYLAKDFNNVLQCGNLNDTILESKGIFNPSHYIILNYKNGNHYELITYKEQGALKFNEISYDIKLLIVNKCLEGDTGPFKIIPEFNSLKKSLNVDTSSMSGGEEINPEYYDRDNVLTIYNKSSPNVLPGRYTGEKIKKSNCVNFLNLNDDWRKKLSNQHSALFNLDGKNWNSVDHYLYGSRYKNNNPDFYEMFSLDSGSPISKNLGLAKESSEKKITDLRDRNIIVDSDYFNGRDKKELMNALNSKFTQNKDLLDVLLKTNQAKLQIYVPRSSPIVFHELMKLRHDLSNNNK